ncbi:MULTISPECIES: CDP-diacylglycerol--glycerol-3-phosphate 3-phosphatidyltransferase [unclassified Breznakia]|uniref:CDP-diacylglycerol--glycerol-3-phosphate 3-phosphatidyltransferase n=1 Tax=unclassified Breznakia TaxID=2623764 RepID=UPI002475E8BE|nr:MULTISPECIES: CDP-diacylglycerol--glycerol-3-phosphate 3-phosphatidyltransferase [unclassified Breznakia]MDH6367214.1 CDP-diacylglycerol--glycerol-3-phosphate 3-phosphatidyltransferase [Breznakia sp. PH1-1]MDH6404366.1 CDP-diacylglycerol--glycerol-3-phosphate 3-phosphatidyltransferase [Breznakia sp. PF1-11]MDH6412075.1 CDP-diacylglycerol--glycerol-3-phosphate 3-phosphatidyltransferase [Breznakia sp. PFB1-11]MDH6414354.1 CDP-diacylglycerol--glycerol-3-phosphate 3-phosphatidyltransferase [Brez
MNLPNKLSLFRVILVPIIVCVYVIDMNLGNIHIMDTLLPVKNVIALLIFAVASFTDFLDGYIARKYQLITSFGKFIDPIADKLLVNTLFILLAVSGQVSVVPVVIMIWRDTLVDGMRMMAAQKGIVVAAGIWGKLKTVLQMFAIIFVLLANVPFVAVGIPVDQILVYAATLVSVISGIKYFMEMKEFILESK